ncbi:hypothetical protein LNTAR_19105 [Lentisphaera araneosa HTCC2155]|uniref:Uncharacterized protein n=1 Tax=Lentisphaera araneosa HTCC2155 TaxID=313628 RepID=A6DNX7_9BACT|nr:hypothetical protein [Lentisphaera araneosa]EDM26786.1 hypothetical protein LNTAR_19105 [Lentisphaera araneosa HTCC2155]
MSKYCQNIKVTKSGEEKECTHLALPNQNICGRCLSQAKKDASKKELNSDKKA